MKILRISSWPDWLCWILFLPLSMLGGLLAGLFAQYIISAPAETNDAPLVFIAILASGFASHYAAFHIVMKVAPKHERIITKILVFLAALSSLSVVYLIIQSEEKRELLRVAGTIAACIEFYRENFWTGTKRKKVNE